MTNKKILPVMGGTRSPKATARINAIIARERAHDSRKKHRDSEKLIKLSD